MQVSVRLHGILRDTLPKAQKGKTVVDLSEGATASDLIAHFGITRKVEVSINEMYEADENTTLNDGDQVHLFTVIGGGDHPKT